MAVLAVAGAFFCSTTPPAINLPLPYVPQAFWDKYQNPLSISTQFRCAYCLSPRFYAGSKSGAPAGCADESILRENLLRKTSPDTASGAKADRPGLAEALSHLREGDTLVVWKLDRLGRSLKQLIEIAQDLEKRGVGLRSLQEQIDSTTPGGKLVFHVFGALAEFERDLVKERTNAGLSAARSRGRVGGRKPALTGEKVKAAFALYSSKTVTVAEICTMLEISRTSLYRLVKTYALTEQDLF